MAVEMLALPSLGGFTHAEHAITVYLFAHYPCSEVLLVFLL
jgi:hypothetical protein